MPSPVLNERTEFTSAAKRSCTESFLIESKLGVTQTLAYATVPRRPWPNHLEERLLDQAHARASYTPPFLGSFT